MSSPRPRTVRDLRVALRRIRVMPSWVRRADRATADRINGGVDATAVDRAFGRLSRAADRGVLWFGIAALLTVLGRRDAAARGVLSLVAASILANLVGKQVFGGDRPLLEDIPVGRRLRAHPKSPSFPSGHSASAAAFAVGVALEAPAAGALIAPLAGGVAYSRLHTGAHWLSDVVGGVALGASVAALGSLLPHTLVPRQAIGGLGTPVALPAIEDGTGLFLVANSRSGRHVARRDPLRVVQRRLPRAHVHLLKDGETAEQAVVEALARPNPPLVLGVCGGDGTVSALAGIARRAELPLLVVPGGTFNHFARATGAVTADEAIDALQAGAGLSVDVAEAVVDGADPITVLNTVSIGLYPDFVALRTRLEDSWTKWGASLLAAGQLLGRLRSLPVSLDGRRATAWSVFVAVDRNDPRLVSTLQRRGLDDRVLDIRVLHAGGSSLRAIGSLIFGRRTSAVLRAIRLMPARSRVESFTTRSLDLTAHARDGEPPRVAHDGELEPAGTAGSATTVRVRVVPDGLLVYSKGPDPED